MEKCRAHCANDVENEKKECSLPTRPTRSVIRNDTKVKETLDGGFLRKSLQELGVSASMNYLVNELQRHSQRKQPNQQKIEKFKGLLELLKLLIVVESPISFQEAFETYDGYQLYSNSTPSAKLEFQDQLLHPVYGLPVYILFKPSHCDGSHHTESLLQWLLVQHDRKIEDTDKEKSGLKLNASNTSATLDSTDSEWDHKCARFLLGTTKSGSRCKSCSLCY